MAFILGQKLCVALAHSFFQFSSETAAVAQWVRVFSWQAEGGVFESKP